MDDPSATRRQTDTCRFGIFEFDAPALELRKAGHLVSVRPQALKLLSVLTAHAGDVVARADLEHALWRGTTFVDYKQGVNHAIRELRAVLGDTAESPRFIQTLPRRGYRFIAAVTRSRWTADGDDDPQHAVVDPVDAVGASDDRRALLMAAVGIAGLLAGAWLVLRHSRRLRLAAIRG